MTTTTIFFGCLLHSLCKKQNRQIKRDRLGRTRRPDRLLRGRQGDKKWQEEEAYSKNENVFFFLSEKTSNSFCSAKCTAGNLLSRFSSSFFVFRTRCEKKRRIDEEEVGLKEREGQVKETQDTTQLNWREECLRMRESHPLLPRKVTIKVTTQFDSSLTIRRMSLSSFIQRSPCLSIERWLKSPKPGKNNNDSQREWISWRCSGNGIDDWVLILCVGNINNTTSRSQPWK